MTGRGLTEAGLARLKLASDPALSSAGQLAFVASWLDAGRDTTRRAVVVSDGRPGGSQVLPTGDSDSWRPRWSPSNDSLAVIRSADGDVRPSVWRPGSAGLHYLAPVAGEVTDLAWSPDGGMLALTTVQRRVLSEETSLVQPWQPVRVDGESGLTAIERRVVVLPADGSPGWDVLSGRGSCWHPRWSPDGTALAFLTSLPSEDGAAGAAQICVTRAPRRPAAASALTLLASPAVTFTWSPCGQELAYLAPPVGEQPDLELRLFRCAADGETPAAELAAAWDRSLGSTVRADDARGSEPVLLWSAAAGRLYFPVADGGSGAIGWADAGGTGYGVLAGGERACLEPGLDPSGRHIAFVSSSPADPGDVRVLDLDTGDERQLTDVNPWLRDLQLPAPRLVTATSAAGTVVQGWLTTPIGSVRDRAPLVVSIHGGPHYPAGWRFTAETLRLAAGGYAVLVGNPRGSGGYGRAFAAAIRGCWGTADWQDVEALADVAAADPAVDGSLVAVTGVSYGGYLTLQAITQTGRFKAAVCENGISNLLGLWGSGAEDDAWLSAEMGGPPWERPADYTAASPLSRADHVATPLLLIHAELDQNCPIGQSEQMFVALRRLGREVTLVRLDGEGHLINLVGRPSRRLARARAVDAWLRQYLKPAGRTSADDD